MSSGGSVLGVRNVVTVPAHSLAINRLAEHLTPINQNCFGPEDYVPLSTNFRGSHPKNDSARFCSLIFFWIIDSVKGWKGILNLNFKPRKNEKKISKQKKQSFSHLIAIRSSAIYQTQPNNIIECAQVSIYFAVFTHTSEPRIKFFCPI